MAFRLAIDADRRTRRRRLLPTRLARAAAGQAAGAAPADDGLEHSEVAAALTGSAAGVRPG